MSYLDSADSLRRNGGQWSAYESTGHCVVLAGPGSGKTRVLTTKVARLLAEEIRAPAGVAVVTYSTECARELRTRLDRLGVEDTRRVFVGTLHSFCLAHILGPYAHLTDTDVPPKLRVAERADAVRMLGDAMETLRIRGDPTRELRDINLFRQNTVTRTQESGWVPGDRGNTDLVIEFERRLAAEELLDFDAMITKAYAVVTQNAWVRRCLRTRFSSFVVDEYQDLGTPLHEMVECLVFGGGMRLLAVGDPDQSIYGFRGARPELLRSLADREGVRSVSLRLNYRSAPSIVRASKLALGEERDYQAERAGDGIVSFHEKPGGVEAQARFIAGELVPRLRHAHEAGDIAILFPTKYEGDAIEQNLQRENIDYVRVGSNSAYPRVPFTRLVEDLARWVAGGWEEGDPRLSRLLHRWAGFLDVARAPNRRTYQLPLVRFLFQSRGDDGNAHDWITRLDESVFGHDDVRIRLTDSGEMDAFERLVEAVAPGGRLDGFSVPNLAGQAGSLEHVNLLTLHSSKGTEFGAVIIAGADDGTLPRGRAPKMVAASRRLFYVGLSRAKDEVHVVYSPPISGDRYRRGPSPFVSELRSRLAAAEAGAGSAAAGSPPVWTKCPECGAASAELRGSQFLDEERDDLYFSVECTACGWSEGGEV